MPEHHSAQRGSGKGRLADQLAEHLLARIKHLAPGTKLPPENRIAQEFDVSRTVVREAISQLKAMGTLRSQQGSGNFVAPPSQTMLSFPDLDGMNPIDIMKFFEIRSGLDAAAARLAATRRTKAQLAGLRAACQRTTEAANPATAAETDLLFHQAIVEATANEHFISVHRFLSAQLKEGIMFTRRLVAGSQMEKDVHAEHRGIFEAIELKDPDLAADRSLDHILNSQHRLKLTLSHLARSIDGH
jgi:GntR family transcriptional regulator, transcriptional repressor for pyruvate dehydrogenase complex